MPETNGCFKPGSDDAAAARDRSLQQTCASPSTLESTGPGRFVAVAASLPGPSPESDRTVAAPAPVEPPACPSPTAPLVIADGFGKFTAEQLDHFTCLNIAYNRSNASFGGFLRYSPCRRRPPAPAATTGSELAGGFAAANRGRPTSPGWLPHKQSGPDFPMPPPPKIRRSRRAGRGKPPPETGFAAPQFHLDDRGKIGVRQLRQVIVPQYACPVDQDTDPSEVAGDHVDHLPVAAAQVTSQLKYVTRQPACSS